MSLTPFAQELTRYRDAAGLTQTQLARVSGLHLSSVNRWERGGSLPKRENAEHLDRVLNADGSLLARFDEARDGFTLPPWSRDLVSIENEARTVDVVAPVLVPGYLQSPRFAELLFRAARPWDTDDEVRRLVRLRCERLHQLSELRVTAVFPVTALTASAVPQDVRREQAAVLREWTDTGRVTLHLVPAGTVLLVPTAPVMVFRVANGEVAVACDYASGSVVPETSAHPRLLAAVTTALASALPATESLELLEGLAS
ncbi:Scr1 family TA system antitoxin-like transcriptional regulator [Nocardiopsis dassonvillei]|uniref:Scr1 family TA system antitoxin-like transcriptional regulator n=1 Tax=Nocardiopsis dassonvillei TaxID=2014 RepID=UPI00157BE18C|nr:Scr1 family TA system antitoxin-like transcriptional regulator [Nocardiopsis dassonvillei]